MPLYVTTTGTVSPVVLKTLGALELVHPTTDLDLENSYPRDSLYGNSELQSKVDAGEITLAKDTGGFSPVNVENLSSAENNEFVSSQTINMTEDITLTVESAAFLYLNPGGADRNVDLPSPANAAGRIIYIFNTGTGREFLDVRDENDIDIARIRRNQLYFFHSDGIEWYAVRLAGAGESVNG